MIDYTIDQVAETLGITKSGLRYWEKVFEIPVKRTVGKQRRYSQETIATFERILELHREGYAVRGIKKQLQKGENREDD
jgi:DNA-binding transcriptional MerR regulator